MTGEVYRKEERPAMVSWFRCSYTDERQGAELEATQVETLGFSLGVRRMDGIGGEHLRRTC